MGRWEVRGVVFVGGEGCVWCGVLCLCQVGGWAGGGGGGLGVLW